MNTDEISNRKRPRPGIKASGLFKNGFSSKNPRGPSSNEATKRTRKRKLFEKAQQLARENKGHIIIMLAFENKKEFSIDLQAFGAVAQQFCQQQSFQNCKKEWEALINLLDRKRKKKADEPHPTKDHSKNAQLSLFEENEGQNSQIQLPEKNLVRNSKALPRFLAKVPKDPVIRTSGKDAGNNMCSFAEEPSSNQSISIRAKFTDDSDTYNDDEVREVDSVTALSLTEQSLKSQQPEKKQIRIPDPTSKGHATVTINTTTRSSEGIAGHARNSTQQIITLSKQQLEQLKKSGKLAHLQSRTSMPRPSGKNLIAND